MKSVKKLVILSVLAAVLFVVQVAFSFLPNIEFVTLLLVVYAHTLTFGESFLVILVFTLMETTVWGIHDWVIGYLWVWSLLIFLSKKLHPLFQEKAPLWAVFGAVWGIVFGILFSLQHGLFYGFSAGLAFYLRGLTLDIIHAVGNYIILLLLYVPVSTKFDVLYHKALKQDSGVL